MPRRRIRCWLCHPSRTGDGNSGGSLQACPLLCTMPGPTVCPGNPAWGLHQPHPCPLPTPVGLIYYGGVPWEPQTDAHPERGPWAAASVWLAGRGRRHLASGRPIQQPASGGQGGAAPGTGGNALSTSSTGMGRGGAARGVALPRSACGEGGRAAQGTGDGSVSLFGVCGRVTVRRRRRRRAARRPRPMLVRSHRLEDHTSTGSCATTTTTATTTTCGRPSRQSSRRVWTR